ncbi:MAG: hypothetical protein HFE63_06575 [Clostridiales bacterium]|nr:hypothetical protein [Clostridiales bacterium]
MNKEQLIQYLINIGRLESDCQNYKKLLNETAASLTKKPHMPWLGLTMSAIWIIASFLIIFSGIQHKLSELISGIITSFALIAAIISVTAFITISFIYDSRLRKYKRQQALLSLLDQKLHKTINELDYEYARNILPPKYRSLTAVAWLYHYIVSDRCVDLDEAYRLYETEHYQSHE